MEEDEYRPLKRGNRFDRDRSDYVRGENGGGGGRHGDSMPDYEDPYLRDENGRPVDLLRKAPAARPRRRTAPETGLKRYFIIGAVFSGLLAASGQLLPAGIVAFSTLILALAVRARR
ncbi:MAG: hypothetical protein QXD32_06250 [Nitrososphaerota archaeon]